MTTYKRWVLNSRPEGVPAADNFKLESVEPQPLPDGHIRVQMQFFSVDPGMRSRLSADSYSAALEIGEPIESAGIGTVTESRSDKFVPGDLVNGGFGWQEEAVVPARGVLKLEPKIFEPPLTVTAAIGVLGIPGLTSYFGLLDLGAPKDGDTVLISSAAGPVGATAGQIAKLKGCRAVGIAGSAEKCAYLTDELGFDAAIDYKAAPDLRAAIKQTCPDGVDIYFDNVGGEMLDTAITMLKPHGRIVVSGQISEYNRPEPRGIRNVTRFITHRLRMEGLVVFDYARQFGAAQAEMAGWIRDGKLSYREEIVEGIENAPAAFIGLFEGAESFGRRLIKVR